MRMKRRDRESEFEKEREREGFSKQELLKSKSIISNSIAAACLRDAAAASWSHQEVKTEK